MKTTFARAATTALALLMVTTAAEAETLRLLTWGGYAPDNVIKLFEEANPDITVEVTLSNNEEMVAKLRATGGAGYDLAQPSHDRIFAAQSEYNIYKPLDLSKVETANLAPNLLEGVKANATIDGKLYAVPHQWGTSGLVADISKAPDVKGWGDLCNPEYKGRTSMRLRRTILLGTAFGLGKDPFALYADKAAYQKMLDEVTDKLIACKSNVKTYWNGGDDLSTLLLSGEVVVLRSLGFHRLQALRPEQESRLRAAGNRCAGLDRYLRHSPQGRGRRCRLQVDQLRHEARDRQADVGLHRRHRRRQGRHRPPSRGQEGRRAGRLQGEGPSNLKFFANIPPGIEDMEGKALERIKAAQSN